MLNVDIDDADLLGTDDADSTSSMDNLYTEVDDEAARIFELQDELSFDIITKNIRERLRKPTVLETINYVSEFKKRYDAVKADEEESEMDADIISETVSDLCQFVVANIGSLYSVQTGAYFSETGTSTEEECLEVTETLYNFFVVRHYSNIKDYFKSVLMKNKIDFIERYKDALDDKEYDDLFLSQDKKKFKDLGSAIIIHFINDIIDDIRSQEESGLALFKKIVDTDLYEEYNSRMNELLDSVGIKLIVTDDQAAAKNYLKILDNAEIKMNLRNDLLSDILLEAAVNE